MIRKPYRSDWVQTDRNTFYPASMDKHMAYDKGCQFCQIVNGEAEAEVILEQQDYLCILDKYPVTEGHSLVIPKSHIEQLEQIEDPAMFEFLERAHEEILNRYSPDGTNIGINNGAAAGQTVPHIHWHIIPRYNGDMDDPKGGVRGVIPEKQKY